MQIQTNHQLYHLNTREARKDNTEQIICITAEFYVLFSTSMKVIYQPNI